MWEEAYRKGLRFGGLADTGWIVDNLHTKMKILETGCGEGKTYLALRKKGFDVMGVDISEIAISRLIANASSLGIEANVGIGDASNMKFSAGEFDAVISIHLLDAMASDRDVFVSIAETLRVLKTGGVFISEVFCVEDFRNGRGEKLDEKRYRRNGIVTAYFREEEYIKLLSTFTSVNVWHHRFERNYGKRCVLRAICKK